MVKKLLLSLCLVVLTAAMLLVAVNLLVTLWGGAYILAPDEVPEAEAILVLGASVYGNRELSAMLQDRVDTAIDLHRAGKAPRLLMSGDHRSRYYDEVGTMKRYAVEAGVDSSCIFLDHRGLSTFDSVLRARDIFGLDRVIIVTQGYHLYRAVFLARAMGMDAYGVASDRREYSNMLSNHGREFLARVKDAVTVLLPAKAEGEPVDMDSDGNLTDTP